MRRGEIFYVNLDPASQNAELKKTRVLVVSNNANNNAANTITIVPLSSTITRVFPFEVLMDHTHSGLNKPVKAQCHQIRTISKSRLIGQKIGQLNSALMQKVDQAIKLHLSL